LAAARRGVREILHEGRIYKLFDYPRVLASSLLTAQGKYSLKAPAHLAALDAAGTTRTIDIDQAPPREGTAPRRGRASKGFRRMSGQRRRARGRIPAMPPRLRAQPAQAKLDPCPNAFVTVIEEQFGHQLGAADRG